MIIRLASSPWGGGYSSPVVGEPWPEGEVREVPDEVGEYLLSTFPEQFVEYDDDGPDPEPKAPELPDPPPPRRLRRS